MSARGSAHGVSPADAAQKAGRRHAAKGMKKKAE